MLLQKSNTNSFELPVCKQNRLDSLDVLRGVALCGVFLTHFICQFYGLSFTPVTSKPVIATPLDPLFERLLRFVLFDKPRGMFAFLFGVGFYYQLVKGSANGLNFRATFLKRLVMLFLFGLIHAHFFFEGDVLRYYAVLGLFLLFSHKLKPKVLLSGAVLFSVVLPCVCIFFTNDLFIGNFNTPAASAIFGQFLFGFWAARKKIFENLSVHQLNIKKIFVSCLTLNLTFTALRGFFSFASSKGWLLIGEGMQYMLDVTFIIGIQAMIFVYITGVLMLFSKARGKKRWDIFIPAGRMTLTNYIAQSVIAILLFEIGIYPLLGTVVSFFVCILLCMMQLYTSKWWLSYYKSGPLEWIWRSLAATKWQPWKRSRNTNQLEVVIEKERENVLMEPALSRGLTG